MSLNNLPWYGWVLLAVLLLIVLAVNLSLILTARHKKGISTLKIPEKQSSKEKSNNVFGRLAEGIRHPWKKEDDMLAELSRLTDELRRSSESGDDAGDKPD